MSRALQVWHLALPALLLCAAAGQAQTIDIVGSVSGPRGPLRGAVVRIVGTPVVAVTDSAGRFAMRVAAGPHVCQAAAPRHAPQNKSCAISPREPRVDFVLAEQQGPLAILEEPGGDRVPLSELRTPFADSLVIGERTELRFKGFEPFVGQVLMVTLSANDAVLAQATSIERGPNGGFTWIGVVLDSRRAAGSAVTLVVRNGQLTGNVRFHNRLFHVRPKQGRLHYVFEVALAKVSIDEGPPLPPSPRRPPPAGAPAALPPPFDESPIPFPPWIEPMRVPWIFGVWQLPRRCTDFSEMVAGTVPSIRVLVLYTDAVAAADAFIDADVELMAAETNVAYVESGIAQRIEIAAVRLVPGYAEEGASAVHRDRLVSKVDGYLNDVHALRDALHADIVALVVETPTGGAAARQEGTYEVSRAMEAWAFAVTNRVAGLTTFQFAHELGHVMGAQHDRFGAPVGEPYAYNFGYGPPSNAWKTIMAYLPLGVERVGRFSNPDLLFTLSDATPAEPTGIAHDSPLAADNRRALNNTSAVVAGFRLSPVWMASLGADAPWKELRVADEGMADVLFGDFNGDREADGFRVDAEAQQWYWSPSGTGAWQPLGSAGPERIVPITELRLVDLNGDGIVDVFRSNVADRTWYWSKSGTAPWSALGPPDAAKAIPVSSLLFGDFDHDAKIDVFYSDEALHRWLWAPGGVGPWQLLNSAEASTSAIAVPTEQLAIGDFDGDGFADVFQSVPASGLWRWSPKGRGGWATLRTWSEGILATRDYAFGDFDGDTFTDVFRANGMAWHLSSGGVSDWKFLFNSCFRVEQLRFANVDGDGTLDVVRAGIRP